MNPTLLKSQFDRLARDPRDTRLLKQLAVELGSSVVRSRPEWLRHYRLAAASALRVIEVIKPETKEITFARGVLSALLDAAGCAEETLTSEQEREEVRSIASRPLHCAILKSLNDRSQITKTLAEQLNRQKSQVNEALHDLVEVGLVSAVERLPQANQKEKPYRLTLSGVAILDELPKDEEASPSPEFPKESSAVGFWSAGFHWSDASDVLDPVLADYRRALAECYTSSDFSITTSSFSGFRRHAIGFSPSDQVAGQNTPDFSRRISHNLAERSWQNIDEWYSGWPDTIQNGVEATLTPRRRLVLQVLN
ncbi:MAG TPA: winged helix DNA-binding protein [Gemmata sp.]|jgi:DNA-binding MarR family transcriptional regulator|nr:winged helix DNA-binding protein [Gemmata sp.]